METTSKCTVCFQLELFVSRQIGTYPYTDPDYAAAAHAAEPLAATKAPACSHCSCSHCSCSHCSCCQTPACSLKNVPRDIVLTEFSEDLSDCENEESIDSFQSSEELMDEDFPIGCGHLKIGFILEEPGFVNSVHPFWASWQA